MASIFKDDNQVAYYELRKKENELLKETDFYALSDVTLSSSIKKHMTLADRSIIIHLIH